MYINTIQKSIYYPRALSLSHSLSLVGFRLQRRSARVHQSRIVGEWRNRIGYQMVLHRPWFTLQPRLLQWRTSSMDEKKIMVANMATFFAREILWWSSFLGNSNPLTRNLTHEELQLEVFFFVFFLGPILSVLPTIALTSLAISWNSRLTNALLHQNLN